ncbi:hypothetical protein HHI36_019625 [Cryptolaemus montrouzieri]|uniref:Uncharacterized protein n=1 Tax=Cryptolaemus montrouzieri TaxID=559131 RepID=A0ABD2N8N7_9CUCU
MFHTGMCPIGYVAHILGIFTVNYVVILDDSPSIPSCLFYGKQEVRVPPPTAVPENSESSDVEEETTLKSVKEKIRQSNCLFEGEVVTHISFDFIGLPVVPLLQQSTIILREAFPHQKKKQISEFDPPSQKEKENSANNIHFDQGRSFGTK